jgi:hypothetical protein
MFRISYFLILLIPIIAISSCVGTFSLSNGMLFISIDEIDFGDIEKNQESQVSVTFYNTGTNDAEWSVTPEDNWISISPSSGSISIGDSAIIIVSVISSDLSLGEHSSKLSFDLEAKDKSISATHDIQVNFSLTPPRAGLTTSKKSISIATSSTKSYSDSFELINSSSDSINWSLDCSADWLDFSLTSGELTESNETINYTINPALLEYGDNTADIVISTDETGKQNIHLPVNLTYIFGSYLVVEDEHGTILSTADGFDFGSCVNNTTTESIYVIKNIGSTQLSISSNITTTDSDNFSVHQPSSFSLNPDSTSDFSVFFEPDTKGDVSADVTISSNDPLKPSFRFRLTAQSVANGSPQYLDQIALPKVWNLAISPDNKNLYAACTSENKIVSYSINPVDGSLTYLSEYLSFSPNSIEISANGEYVFCSMQGYPPSDNPFSIWDRNSGTGALTEQFIMPLMDYDSHDLIISDDGSRIYTCNANGRIYSYSFNQTTKVVLQLNNIDLSSSLLMGTAPNNISISPDNTKIFIAGKTFLSVDLDPVDKSFIPASVVSYELTTECYSATPLHSGDFIYISTDMHRTKQYSINGDGTLEHKDSSLHAGDIIEAVITDDDRFIYMADKDNGLKWDAFLPGTKKVANINQGAISLKCSSVVLSPDNTIIYTAINQQNISWFAPDYN